MPAPAELRPRSTGACVRAKQSSSCRLREIIRILYLDDRRALGRRQGALLESAQNNPMGRQTPAVAGRGLELTASCHSWHKC